MMKMPFVPGCRAVAVLMYVAALCLPAMGVEWVGECVRVSDGDTVTIMYHELPIKVRLYGIDAPERGQDFGTRSRQRLGELVHGRMVRVDFVEWDHYNRAVAVLFVDDVAVNAEMVACGMAWVFEKYCRDPYLGEWRALEDAAREARTGLWSHGAPMPPWEYRAMRKSRRDAKRAEDMTARSAATPTD